MLVQYYTPYTNNFFKNLGSASLPLLVGALQYGRASLVDFQTSKPILEDVPKVLGTFEVPLLLIYDWY